MGFYGDFNIDLHNVFYGDLYIAFNGDWYYDCYSDSIWTSIIWICGKQLAST